MSETASSRKVRLLTVGVLAATFALGVVTGGGICTWVAADRLDPQDDGLPRGPWPLRELELSDEQHARIREIFERHRPKLDVVLRDSFPLVRSVHEAIDGEIREVLTHDQRVQFDLLKQRRPFPPPPPGRAVPPGAPPFPPPERP